MKAALLLLASVALAGAQTFHSDEEFYRYLENRQRMALVEAQARAWAQQQAREEELYKPLPIDEELEAEMDAFTRERAREAMQWLRDHPSLMR